MSKAKHQYKRLKAEEAKEYIKQHHGIKQQRPAAYFCNLYECDDNILIVENTKENKFTLYYDRTKYYAELMKSQRLINERPLLKQQPIIRDIKEQKTRLVSQLFSELGITQPDRLTKVDLKQLDKQLKAYGYEKAYYNLLLNLIVFCGEYVREYKAGNWVLQDDLRHPGEVIPVYVDSTGRKYEFWINTLLIRQYPETGKFDISSIIEGALQPEVFKIVPNQGKRNPNE